MALSIKERVTHWSNNNPQLSWRSGKWFLYEDEIGKSRIDRYLLRNTDCRDVADCGRWKDCYIAMYGDYDAEWPQLRIITEAKQKLARGEKPTKLAYPLTDKELKLFNYILVGDPEYAIFFYGVGGSGKSTICNILCKIFGEDNCCYTSLADINRFNVQFEGARLWFDDDINAFWSDSKSAKFKPMVTNGYTSFEEKGRTPRSGKYRCKCLFASNHPVKFDITDTGVLRRIIYYKKDTKIENPDNSLVGKVYTHDELVNIVMKALCMNMENWEDDFRDETREVIMSSNSVWKYGMVGDYATYCSKCISAGCNSFGEEKWTEIRELFEGWTNGNSSHNG